MKEKIKQGFINISRVLGYALLIPYFLSVQGFACNYFVLVVGSIFFTMITFFELKYGHKERVAHFISDIIFQSAFIYLALRYLRITRDERIETIIISIDIIIMMVLISANVINLFNRIFSNKKTM